MAARLSTVDQIKSGLAQAVPISQTSQVVSNAFEIGADDALSLAWQVNATVTSGTAAIVKLQQSFDSGATWADQDATNSKVTLAATGNYAVAMSAFNTTFGPKMPLGRLLRFVCTTTGADAVTINHIYVQIHA